MASAYFDTLSVKDGYSSAHLFYGQMDLYEGVERDGTTSYRRSLSAAAVTRPARGVVLVGSERFICGREIKDYFDGVAHRSNLLLHPVDGSVSVGTASTFLTTPTTPTAMYMAGSWLKNSSDEERTSTLTPVIEFHLPTEETVTAGMIIKNAAGSYHRVMVVNTRTSLLKIAVAYELGTAAKRSITYTARAAYSVANDAYGTVAPLSVSVFVENWQTQYVYPNQAVEKLQVGDLIITVQTIYMSPTIGETIVDSGRTYHIIGRQNDGAGCWNIQVRPV